MLIQNNNIYASLNHEVRTQAVMRPSLSLEPKLFLYSTKADNAFIHIHKHIPIASIPYRSGTDLLTPHWNTSKLEPEHLLKNSVKTTCKLHLNVIKEQSESLLSDFHTSHMSRLYSAEEVRDIWGGWKTKWVRVTQLERGPCLVSINLYSRRTFTVSYERQTIIWFSQSAHI